MLMSEKQKREYERAEIERDIRMVRATSPLLKENIRKEQEMEEAMDKIQLVGEQDKAREIIRIRAEKIKNKLSS